jgi:cell wall-associated protease
MKKIVSLLFIGTVTLCKAQNSPAPTAALKGWHLQSQQAGYHGIELDAAYRFLAAKKLTSTPVTVAVLDSGIDTAHEDLKPVLWVNPREVPGNGKDDDGNGYVDDIHGWNFLGHPDGRNVNSTSSEWIRVYWRYKDRYEGKTIDPATLSQQEQYTYAQWQKARSGVVGKSLQPQQFQNLYNLQKRLVTSDSILQSAIGQPVFTKEKLERFQPKSIQQERAKASLMQFLQPQSDSVTNVALLKDLETYLKSEESKAKAEKEPPADVRRTITGDDEDDPTTLFYGNNDVYTGTPEHGTHVSGIIAAVRNNGLGMDGVADNVRILLVRTTPEGDEHDKDVAMGIRYAVDNGAKIINMSFGKSLSPNKPLVDAAVKYAISRDVLLVHGAGNSSRNIDGHDSYPCPQFLFTDSIAPNWITVGASTENGEAASFSNYGKKAVDVFAPGTTIYSTYPGGNKYESIDGTSMAAPVVSGLAALLRSYFPKLSAGEVKSLIEKSVIVPSNDTPTPGGKERVYLNELCKTGGIVNALQAVQMAAKQ